MASFTSSVHFMGPGPTVTFVEPDEAGRASVLIEDHNQSARVVISVNGARDTSFADAQALSEQLLDVAVALRQLAKDQAVAS